jgi:ubiquinone/menaquinone biosynthesis C-methylase UbiE
MNDDISDIAAKYDSEPEKEHIRLEQHQLEYEMTSRYLDLYLPPRGNLLEIGAATGRYTLGLAKKGYSITAVDIASELLNKNRLSIKEKGFEKQVTYIKADARDLGKLKETTVDAILMMGPLYHLVREADRKLALSQAFQHLRAGGILFTTFISRFGLMGDLLRNTPDWIEKQADVYSVLDYGKDPDDYPRGGFRGYFADPAEIIPLHESIGFESIAMVGLEPGISADDESYNRLQGEQRQRWLDLFFTMSTEKSILGASRHLLYIGRRK